MGESFLTGNSAVDERRRQLNLGAAFNVGSPQNVEFYYSVVPDNGLGQFDGPGSLVEGLSSVCHFERQAHPLGVPEPASVVFVGIGLATLGVGSRALPEFGSGD